MTKITLTVLACAIVCGCATTKDEALTPESIARLDAKSVAVTRHEQPAFIASTAGKTMYGMVGVASQLSSGNRIVEQNDIKDPATGIARTLVDALAQRYNMTVAPEQQGTLLATDNVERIAKRYAATDYVVDVSTIDWTFQYYPGNFNRYRVRYGATFKLIDTKAKSVIAKGSCSRDPEQAEDSPTYDQLLANNAALIKTKLADAATFCADKFITNTLAIEPTQLN